jgi:hypothetical protein
MQVLQPQDKQHRPFEDEPVRVRRLGEAVHQAFDSIARQSVVVVHLMLTRVAQQPRLN